MEITLHSRGPVCCRRPCPTVGRCFRVRPCLCPSSQTPTCCKQVLSVRAVPQMTASSDYPRRRSRKSLIPKTEGSSPRGFAPRPQVGISTQKKNQEEQKEDDAVIEQIGPYAKNVEASSISPISKIPVMLDDVEENDGEGIVSIRSDGNEEEEADIDEMMSRTEWSQDENSDIINSEKGATELITADTDGQMIPDAKKVKSSSISPTSKVPIILEEVKEKHLSTEHEEILSTISDANEEEADYDEIMSRTEWMSDENSDTMNSLEGAMELSTAETDGIVRAKISSKSVISGGLHNVETGETPATKETAGGVLSNKMTLEEKQLISSEEGRHITDTGDDLNFNVREGLDTEESLVDETEIDPQAQIEMLEKIAEENLSKGEKVFVFPNVVMGDKVVQVFLNRGISTLLNEPDIFIKGAFNEWKWKSFTEKLQKSNLHGDWWSCEIHVPKEAYMMDFVFFNGAQVYENNNYKDFHIAVESGMDAHAFEDFLIEEKRRELERLAQEQAERERQAEEQRRKEEEEAGRQADKAQATLEVEKRRQALQHVIKQAVTSVDNLWHIEPSTFKVADTVRLFYNRSSRPLVHAAEIWIHGGYNNWNDGPSIAEKLSCASRQDGDWWYADVVIPDRAFVLDWVFADGPPRNARVYDNNNSQDFHAIVPNYISEDFYWVEEEQRIFNKLQEERKVKEEAVRQKAVKTAWMKAETKSRTMKNFLLSQKHIVYTEPLDVQAGKMATVFYNPSNTVLNGKPDIWFRCSFNRWTHHAGPLPAQKMVPAENGSHVKANAKVPFDAYMMDFVFSDNKEGDVAAYDNKNGMDYHIPVTGGVLKEPPMHIVHVAVEMAPIAKVGGLGDVVTSLSRAVQDLGHTVEIILPKYDCMNLSNVKDFQFNQSFAWGGTEIKVWFGKVEGLSVYFLEPQNGMFWAGCIYGGRNDAERFGFFCHAALEFLLQRGSHPDILHCHDWTSAPVAWLFKEHYRHYGLSDARVVFTIHNLEFGAHFIGKAMSHADKATTVSQTYSREVSGNPAIAPHLPKFHGIVNGIDPDIWDPYNDNFIPVPYTSENVVEGKKAAKEVLQQRLGLKRSDQPLVGIITRLTVQKGIHLIKHAISQTLQRNGQVVLLGSAPDPRIQNDFSNLANQLHSLHGDSVRLCLTYDEPLSHLIYAGADFILVPSIFEPCGLTQLIAMRYGSIPVVRRTGGLYDTVFDVDNDKERAQAQGLEPNGFSFDGADSAGVDYALNRALSAWYDGRDWFNSLCQRVMEQDWSWNRPALDYMELYYSARK